MKRYVQSGCSSKKYGATLSNDITAAKNLSAIQQWLETNVKKGVKKYLVTKLGYEPEDADAYSSVTVKRDEDDPDTLWVRANAELNFEHLTELGDALESLVTKYDKYAYFEAESPGRLVALVDLSRED